MRNRDFARSWQNNATGTSIMKTAELGRRFMESGTPLMESLAISYHLWHETCVVKSGQYEAIYRGMPPLGRGKVGKLTPAIGAGVAGHSRIAAPCAIGIGQSLGGRHYPVSESTASAGAPLSLRSTMSAGNRKRNGRAINEIAPLAIASVLK